MGTWREIFSAEQRKLPRNATPDQRAEATRRASRIYRGLEAAPARARRTRRNPSGGGLVKLGLLGGAAYLGLKLLGKSAAPNPPATPG